MKHLLLLFITALIFSSTASSQSYQSFPTGNASWKVIRCWFFYPADGYDVYTFNQSGDTTFGAFTYHKIYMTTHHLPGSSYDTTYTQYYGAIREDQKKIYELSEYATGDNLERTLYDFSAENVGDTVTSNLVNYGDPIVVKNLVAGIDSVLIDGNYHRRLKFVTLNGIPTGEIWTEGIGSNFGLIYPRFYLVTDNSYDLRCFTTESISYQNNQLLLGYCQSNPPVDCDLATNTGTASNPSHLFIFPNPAADHLHLRLSVSFVSATISIYSVVGSLISKTAVNDSNMDLDISSLSPGSYFIQLNAHGLTEKILFIRQ